MNFENSWDGVRNAAQYYGAKFPDLVASQWALESGWGKHTSGINNFFGLKGSGSNVSTQEFYDGWWVTIKAGFIDFPTLAACVEYLVSRWYKDWKNYKGVNRAATIKEAANMLISEGYATDPEYASKLLRIIATKGDQPVSSTEYADVLSAAKHFKGLPHQINAFRSLNALLTEQQKKVFTEAWRQSTAAQVPSKIKFPIQVPYFYQRDSKTGHGERMCFSSSMAMAMDYLNPNAIKGDDDWYLREVLRYGDTVSSDAQLKAARALGFKVDFKTDLSQGDLIEQLDLGIPVPIGVLHKGPVNNPSGGGHWICVTGYDDTHFWCCDPFGEMNVVGGGYVKTGPKDGNQVRYSRKNLMKRWLISSQSDGWGMLFKR